MKKVMIKFITTILFICCITISAYAIETTISDGTPGLTYRIIASDTSTSISASVLTYLGVAAKGAIISAEVYAVRVAFGGTTPTQGVSGVGHTIEAAGGIRIYGYTALSTLKYINYTNGQNAVLQITPLY